MNEASLVRLRDGLSWLAAAFCLCLGLALADGFVDSSRTGPNMVSLLPGETADLSGPLPADMRHASDLVFAVDHPGIAVAVTGQEAAGVFGDRVWRATVSAAPDAAPATGTVIVREPGGDANTPEQAFIVRIFADKASLDEATNSRIRHLFGVSPMAVAGGCALGAALSGVAVFMFSRRLAALRAVRGNAVVFMTKKTPDGLLISFGLGADHGLAPGSRVAVHDAAGRPVATATVVRCAPDEAAALVTGEKRVLPGSIVTRFLKEGAREEGARGETL
ncbi:conserved hypothetical protein [Solidesulfovibrio fructosivorans JJ]]|uniref:Uncharacterized protein n=1 Tax=Solidesulfovibrio fructosivorans JJ] TaxID=596151 RepID=E1JSI6_SOLFR|nr:hypothetical protein [Solidesulfovibrio fructosivorans]EFL52671.1 conserved hypothetical protein [Solidesulfovibrio fructosivorans JJ]]